MSEILFLAHRIPYPPTKGDKIRSWHLLAGLAERCTVHLGAFVDDPADWVHVDALRAVCGELSLWPISRRAALLRSLRGLVTGDPLTTGFYRHRGLRDWVRSLVAGRRLDAVFVYSSSMAQYATALALPAGAPRVIDFCDVDSDKWRQFAASHSRPARWVYTREARLLESCERRAALDFDAALVSAEPEAVLLRRIVPDAAARIRVLANGVDSNYFDPSGAWPNPYPAGTRPIVFTGAMDYFANIDAVRWFAEAAFPAVRAIVPDALFAIVGSNPAPQVKALAKPGLILVTGRVADVRPYLAHAATVVAPLRIARGVQNKVLEAMAMARPVVATNNAVQGIPGAAQAGVIVRDGSAEMATAVAEVLARDAGEVPASRRFVQDRYGWRSQVDAVASLLLNRGKLASPALPAGLAAV
jgi:sugar transferase (PEP-CTERM/EpsH1 system associated)